MAGALLRELNGKRDSLLAVVTELLSKHDPHRNPCDTLLPPLAALRQQLSSAVAMDLEDVWYSAERAISGAHARQQAELRLRTETMYEALLRTASFMLVSPEPASLQHSLQEALFEP